MDPIGKSSGSYGGSIREAGGSFGVMGASKEDQYFREQDQKMIEKMKEEKSSSKETHQDAKNDKNSH